MLSKNIFGKYMSLGNFFRTELTRLHELDFFRHHVSFYQETGKTVFENDKEYKKWLKGIKPEEPPLIDLATDDDNDDDDDKDAKKGGRAPKRRDVKKKEQEKEQIECNKKGTVDMINVK